MEINDATEKAVFLELCSILGYEPYADTFISAEHHISLRHTCGEVFKMSASNMPDRIFYKEALKQITTHYRDVICK